MARHRDVRNMDTGEFEDDYDYGSSYGSSYMDETSLSTSVERDYMYRRGSVGASGHTPKMGHFLARRSDSISSVPEEEEEDEGGQAGQRAGGTDGAGRGRVRARSDSETSSSSNPEDDVDPLNEEEAGRLAQCLEQILDIVGDSIPESSIREVVKRCDFNPEVALNTLLNNPIKSIGRRAPSLTPKPQPIVAPVPAPAPAPPPVVVAAEPPVVAARPKPKWLKAEAMSGPRSRSASPAVSAANGKWRDTAPPSVSTPKVSMRKGELDARARYQKERAGAQVPLNLVVVGHVDSGKSTLMGHLLLALGQVSAKLMHKYETESKKLGKQSFALAWVLDESAEERERGITMDVGQHKFQTASKCVTLLDAPGHKDFIPHMISGAYQADVSILVVNATRGEFEAGFEMGGQTREHALLVRSLGVSQLVVAVNKLDTVGWDLARLADITAKLAHFLRQVGFKESDVVYVPCSGFTGDNLIRPSPHLSSWYTGPTLVEAIDAFKPPERLVDKPFRMFISDIYKGQASGICCAGRIESGLVLKEDKVLIMPLQEVATVKSVQQDELSVLSAFAGDHCSLVLVGPDQTSLANGMVLCDPQNPIPVTKRFEARIVIFNIDIPITKGYTVVLHYGSVQVQAVLKRLLTQIHKSTGEVIKNKPRCLTKACSAVVEVALDTPICLETYSHIRELGRFMLRNGGKTIAAGVVTKIL
ncbi:hypothetical protein TCAL_11670 [Tigriopus californicus]|uniref:Tr-type G domain-containing protein n=1 Tax=Tigriopus californicus TaxID=6832 RepID=A0A553PPL1_TIGCA|nr:protein HBS1-like [Tigriopus californicus]TRY79606.1 hypothetical protein TCAL_11670 [Tigriopus californicus]|eukprot:TCALIF_11670-PA protein Name:"Similar to HBS1L HBS1-like protein (Homo sapiens)" AED:0.08 eAED:0.08 QI:0/-1/0/1/-1/1/1/0/702